MMLSLRIAFTFIATNLFLQGLAIDAQNLDYISWTNTFFGSTGIAPVGNNEEANNHGLFNIPTTTDPTLVDTASLGQAGVGPSSLRGGTDPLMTNMQVSEAVSNLHPTVSPLSTPTVPPVPPIMYIIGGTPADNVATLSFQVYLETFQYNDSETGKMETDACSGSLIANDIILTAAHCLDHAPINITRLGTYYNLTNATLGETVEVCEQLPHPGYARSGRKEHDIALLRLCQESVLAKKGNAVPIRLNSNESCPFTNQSLILVGWGKTFRNGTIPSDILQTTTLYYNSTEDCNKTFQNHNNINCSGYNTPEKKENCEEYITPDEMCASAPNTDQCEGDSGGALIIGSNKTNYVQVGVTSHTTGDCPSVDGLPGVYSRISFDLEWILNYGCLMTSIKPCGIKPVANCNPTALKTKPPKKINQGPGGNDGTNDNGGPKKGPMGNHGKKNTKKPVSRRLKDVMFVAK